MPPYSGLTSARVGFLPLRGLSPPHPSPMAQLPPPCPCDRLPSQACRLPSQASWAPWRWVHRLSLLGKGQDRHRGVQFLLQHHPASKRQNRSSLPKPMPSWLLMTVFLRSSQFSNFWLPGAAILSSQPSLQISPLSSHLRFPQCPLFTLLPQCQPFQVPLPLGNLTQPGMWGAYRWHLYLLCPPLPSLGPGKPLLLGDSCTHFLCLDCAYLPLTVNPGKC